MFLLAAFIFNYLLGNKKDTQEVTAVPQFL